MVRSVSARGIAFKFLRAAQENKRLLAFVQAQTPDQPDKSSLKAPVSPPEQAGESLVRHIVLKKRDMVDGRPLEQVEDLYFVR